MDVDSLLCLNSVEKSSFEMLRLRNAKKSLSEILKTLEESIDCVVHDAGEDAIAVNSNWISNSVESNNSSAAALGDLIDVVSSTIKELKDISEKKKTNSVDRSRSDEQLITLADKDQPNTERFSNYSKIPEKRNEITSRYPELFEIFSEKSEFSNFSLTSETETWGSKNFEKSFTYGKPEKFVENSDSKLENFQRSKVNYEDAEVTSDKDSTLVKPTMKRKDFHQKEMSLKSFREDVLPEKLSFVNFQNNPERLEKNSFGKFMSFTEENSSSEFKTLSIQSESSVPNKLTNSKSGKEFQVSTKRKKSCDKRKVHENRSSSMLRIKTSSLENIPPLSATTILSSRTEASNSSLNSWRTLNNTPRSNNENNFSGSSFLSKSIYELEIDSKEIKSGIKRGRLKWKTGDRTKIKKKKRLSSKVEKVQGDNEIELTKSRILVVKSDTKINSTELKGKNNNGKEQTDVQDKILMDVFDILVEVESSLFENRKLAESIQERFQNCSVLQTVVSANSTKLLNEEISRCSMSLQHRENNRDLIIGANELLMDSVLNLTKAVKGEKDYLKQQEYYYCKYFSDLMKNNKRTGNLKRTTRHALIGNESLLSLSQKDKIEELISYTIALIQKIIPKNAGVEKDIEILNNIPIEKSSRRNSMSHVRAEKDPHTQIEISLKSKKVSDHFSLSKSENKKSIQMNFNDQLLESEPRLDPTFVKSNPEPLKMIKNYSSNEKFTRSSTLVLHGSYYDSKRSSNQVIKAANKGRCSSTTQPIWRPAGNAKVSIPHPSISRQKTRPIFSTSDKKKEKQNEGLTRNLQSTRNISAKESSILSPKSQIQQFSTNFKSSDLVKKSDMRFSHAGQKKEAEVKSKSESRKANWTSKSQEDSHKKNLSLNQDLGMIKRKSKQPDVIKVLKELIESTSEEDNKNDRKTVAVPKNLETSECDIEVSVRYLKSTNKIDSSRSSLTSMSITKQENVDNSSKIKFNLQKSKTSSRIQKPLKNFPKNKNDVTKPAIKLNTTLNPLQSRIHVEENKSRILKTNRAKTPNSKSENSLAKSSAENKINSAHVINSKSKIIIKENKLEGKDSRNESLKSLRSRNLKSRSDHKEFRTPYLRKNANNSSYLQSYIRLNSRQNLVSKNSCNSSREKCEVRIEETQNVVESVQENEVLKTLIPKDMMVSDFEPEQDISQFKDSCEFLTKGVSSKFCQVSLEPSNCSRISDLNKVVETEVNSPESHDQSSEEFSVKKKFVNKHGKLLLSLKNILQQHGLDVDLVDEAERKLGSKQKGSSKSIHLDQGDDTLLAVCSSQTLYDKLVSLSDSSFEELEIKDAMNQCSLESFDQEIELSGSQEYFQNSETSFSSLSVKKSRNSASIGVTNRRDAASSPEQKVSVLSQTNLSSNKSEECQTSFVKNADTATEKIIFENLVYTNVEVSCSLENSIISKKEASTEISFKTSCCEMETQTKINPEKDTITDFDSRNLEKEDPNIAEEILVDQETNLKTLDINVENEEEKSETDSFLENENLCKFSEEFSLVDSISRKETLHKKEDIKFQTFKEDSDRENKNHYKFSEEFFSVDSTSREETFDEKKDMKLQDFEEDSGKKSVSKSEISSIQVVDEILKEFSNSTLKEIVKESEEIQEGKEIMKNGKENDSASNFESFSESEDIYLINKFLDFEEIMSPETKFINFCNSYKEIPITRYSSQSEISIPIETINVQEDKSETNSQVNYISKLEVRPSFLVFCNKTVGISTTKLSSDSKMEIEIEKNTDFKGNQNFKDLEKFSESYKNIPAINCSSKTEKGQIFRECKDCGGKCKVSLNLTCPSELGISASGLAAELFKARNQDSFSTETVSSDNNSLSALLKYENRQTEKFMVEPQNRLPQNLAVATLKLATKRAQNLYEEVVICRQSLSSRQSWDSNKEKSIRGNMKRPFEESKKLEEENVYMKLSAKRKKEAKDILENDLNLDSRKKILERAEDFYQENKPNFLTIDISNFKSKTLRTTLQGFKEHEISLLVHPEIREVMIYLLENVEKNLEKENIDMGCKLEERNDERKNLKFQFGNQTFLKKNLLPIIYIAGAIFFYLLYRLLIV